MKLYATTTSERASKGQGGNEYLDIRIKGEDSEELWQIMVVPGEHPLITIYENGNGVHLWSTRAKKGEKKKDESAPRR